MVISTYKIWLPVGISKFCLPEIKKIIIKIIVNKNYYKRVRQKYINPSLRIHSAWLECGCVNKVSQTV